MTACSLINFAINPELLKEEIDSVIKSDGPNKYLHITNLSIGSFVRVTSLWLVGEAGWTSGPLCMTDSLPN